MGAIGCQNTSPTIVYSTVYSGADKKNQSSASLALVRGIQQWLVNSPHKGPVTRKMFPFDDVMMNGLAIETQQEIYAKKCISQKTFNCIFVNENYCTSVEIYWFFFKGI